MYSFFMFICLVLYVPCFTHSITRYNIAMPYHSLPKNHIGSTSTTQSHIAFSCLLHACSVLVYSYNNSVASTKTNFPSALYKTSILIQERHLLDRYHRKQKYVCVFFLFIQPVNRMSVVMYCMYFCPWNGKE